MIYVIVLSGLLILCVYLLTGDNPEDTVYNRFMKEEEKESK